MGQARVLVSSSPTEPSPESFEEKLSSKAIFKPSTQKTAGTLQDMDRRRIPTRGLDDVLLPTVLKDKLWKVVHHEKARAVLCGQWGFGQHGDMDGTVCLFSGPPGTGKTLAAEAVGFETGKQLKVLPCLPCPVAII